MLVDKLQEDNNLLQKKIQSYENKETKCVDKWKISKELLKKLQSEIRNKSVGRDNKENSKQIY